MNIWEFALLIISVTFMVVNIWQMIISTKILKKVMPMVDGSLKYTEKVLEEVLNEEND